MFWKITWFELRYWLRSWMLWIFFLLIGVSIFFAVSTPYVSVGFVLTNTHHNAPFVIQGYYAIIGLIMLFMAPAFVNSAALRDFRYNTNQIVFSTPISRRDFLLGRFIGGTLLSVVPMLGIFRRNSGGQIHELGGSRAMGARGLVRSFSQYCCLCSAECVHHGSHPVRHCRACAQ